MNPYILPIPGVIALYVIILMLCVVGNATVVIVVIKKRGMQTFTNYLILNLAVADLSAALICIPLELPLEINGQQWIYGSFFCTIFYPVQTTTIYGSVFTLVIMSCSRYWAIMHPFRKQPTVFTAKVLICVIWFCSLLLIVPYMLVLEYDEEQKECKETWSNKHKHMYTLAIFVFQYVLPLVIITLAYSFIFYEFAVKNTATKSLYEDKDKAKEANRLVKLLLIITITFAICIMPYHVVALFLEFGDAVNFEYIDDVMLGCYFLLYLNSVLNPIIYNIFSSNFREAFMELYTKCTLCVRERKSSTEGKLKEYTRTMTIVESISIRSPNRCFSAKTVVNQETCCNNNVGNPCYV